MSDIGNHLPRSTECITLLTRGQTLGLFITTEVGFVSGFAVLFVFNRIIRNVLRNSRRVQSRNWQFLNSPLDVYMLSLFMSDLLQALGGILNIRWVAQGSVRCGPSCTAQGVMKQLGENGVAMATLAIAVHTFFIIFFRRGAKATYLASIVVCIIWLYVIIFVVASVATHNKQGDEMYTPTPYWCWISSRFKSERIAGEYFWLWFTAFVSLALYIPLFFCLRGNITVDDKRWRVRFRQRPHSTNKERSFGQNVSPGTPMDESLSHLSENPAREALTMLLYPVCYVALILPLSVGRWIGFGDNDTQSSIPSAAAFAFISIFGFSGLVNAILLIWTRPGILADITDNPLFEETSEFSVVHDTRRCNSASV